MVSKQEIGRRMKKVREQKHLTLKNVEARAGISATHISEIERGKTSPTINALMRIAYSLGKDPAYFIENDELDDVSFVALEDRSEIELNRARGVREMLTRSIPGGRINAQFINMGPSGGEKIKVHTHIGEEAALVLKGDVRFRVDGKDYQLGAGDSIYYEADLEHGYLNMSDEQEARIIWFGSERRID